MRPPKYPLEPLAVLRDRRVDAALGELAAAGRALDSAERERVVSEQKNRAHSAEVDRVRDAEADALTRGDLRAADLANAGAWEVRVASERRALAAELDRARASEAGAREGQHRAGRAAGARQAEARVVSKDRTRWLDALHKRREAKEEEAASEASRPVRRSRSD